MSALSAVLVHAVAESATDQAPGTCYGGAAVAIESEMFDAAIVDA